MNKDLRRILADRHSPEAAALFQTLLDFVERRVAYQARTRCRGLLADADQEELIGEVLFQLMEGALMRFRGESTAELHAFVRTMTDRTVIRRAQRRLRERETVEDLRDSANSTWVRRTHAAPDEQVEFDAVSPLDETDQDYLRQLIAAGSKAELARLQGVSRAAVTQRIARIRARLEGLSPPRRAAHEVWLKRTAADAIDGQSLEHNG